MFHRWILKEGSEDSMEDITIMLTGVGAPGAYSIIKSLQNNGERNIRIIGCDCNEEASCRNMVDVFYQIPYPEEKEFFEKCMEICRKEGIRVIIPLVTRELWNFAKNKKRFEENNIKVMVLEEEILSIANDKASLLKELKNKGMEVPFFIECKSYEEIENGLENSFFRNKPIVVKVSRGNGSRGIRIIDEKISEFDIFMKEKPNSLCCTKEHLLAMLKNHKLPRILLMEYLPGEEYCVDVLADRGKVLKIATKKSTLVQNSISIISQTVNDADLNNYCIQVIKVLNLSGNIGFDFKCNEFGKPMIMEINPRLTATVALNTVAGINFPYLGIKYLLGEPIPKTSFQTGVLVKRRYEERYYADGKEIIF